MEDFGDLLGWGVEFTEAAARVGVSAVTARRYLAELGQQQREGVAA